MKPVGGGAAANKSGKLLENIAGILCEQYGYEYMSYKDWARFGDTGKCIIRGYPYPTIYNHNGRGDGTIIANGRMRVWLEAKRQMTTGSVDEKFPYVLANAIERWRRQAEHVCIVHQGNGFKEGAIFWLKAESAKANRTKARSEGLIHVQTMGEFLDWFNSQQHRW